MNEKAKVPGKDDTILVAGARGMVGSALVRRLAAGGYTRVLAPSCRSSSARSGASTRA